jgi:uncharacterized protein (TIGR00255 family)
MIKSMTGFGRAEVSVGSKKITVEVRTLNGKQLDLNIKMPAAYRPVEYELRALASSGIGRGKTDVYVMVEDSSPAGGAKVNAAVFGAYYRQIKEAAEAAGVGFDGGEALTAAILRLPDVLVAEVTDAPEEEDRALAGAFEEAVAALDKFRIEEGRILMYDMLCRVDLICALADRVAPFEKARVDVIRRRILDHIASLGIEADHNRLEQELVFYVEKFDITEEKVRLAKHCEYFRETAREEDGVGRKLGFVAQEMGREINTLGSKANDPEIQKLVVQMKDELEKIKEQLLNIL